jgi:hypothetical protein
MRRILLALCLIASTAVAQEEAKEPASESEPNPNDEKTSPDEGQIKLNDGKYGGVSPGAQNLPPKAPKMPLKRGPQRLTWSGFQVKDGTPTVFLELTGTPDYNVSERGNEIVVTLRNTVVPIKNNRRPLRVEAFKTPVKTVETATKGRETKVVIHTQNAMSHKERVEQAAGGFQMLLIELSAR